MSSTRAIAISFDATSFPVDARGAARYALDVVAALAGRDDVSVTVVTRRGDGGRWALPGTTRVLARAPNRRPVRLAWEQLALPRVIREAGVEVHHGPHYTMPLRAPVPSVVTVHDMTFFDHPEWHERVKVPIFRRAITEAARRAAAILVPSQTTADLLLERFTPSGPVIVALHGVDHTRFRPGPEHEVDDRAALARLGLRNPYVLFGPATLEPRKGVPTLVRAFDAIASDHVDADLVLAGGRGWGGHHIEAALESARHRERIKVLGFVADEVVPALLRQAAVVAYPSLQEGFGLTALEALACGAPLVTTKGSAMEEVAGDAALLVAPGDEDALAAALDAILRGDAALPSRRAAGLARATAATWEAAAARHVDAYRVACGARH